MSKPDEHSSILRPIAGVQCGHGECPTIYEDDAHVDDVVVQGKLESMTTPPGEAAVRLPKAMILEAAAKLGLSPR